MFETGVEVAGNPKPNPNQIWKYIEFFVYSFDLIYGQLFNANSRRRSFAAREKERIWEEFKEISMKQILSIRSSYIE